MERGPTKRSSRKVIAAAEGNRGNPKHSTITNPFTQFNPVATMNALRLLRNFYLRRRFFGSAKVKALSGTATL